MHTGAPLSLFWHGSVSTGLRRARRTMVFPGEAFDPLDTLKTVQDERCTALHGVPTMFIMELDHPDFSSFDMSTLRTGIMAGAPCPVEVMRRLISEMHMKDILIGYGQTEVSPINNMTLPTTLWSDAQKRWVARCRGWRSRSSTIGACSAHREKRARSARAVTL